MYELPTLSLGLKANQSFIYCCAQLNSTVIRCAQARKYKSSEQTDGQSQTLPTSPIIHTKVRADFRISFRGRGNDCSCWRGNEGLSFAVHKTNKTLLSVLPGFHFIFQDS